MKTLSTEYGAISRSMARTTSSRAVIAGVNAAANYLYTYEMGLAEEET